jgi:hypothetical protein
VRVSWDGYSSHDARAPADSRPAGLPEPERRAPLGRPDSPAAVGSTLAHMSMLEICHCCQSFAPAWSSPEYAEWHVVISADGELLGVVCAGCLIDDELIAVELDSSLQPA